MSLQFRKAPVTRAQILLSALIPSLATFVASGKGTLAPGVKGCGFGIADHGVRDARSHAKYFASSERTRDS